MVYIIVNPSSQSGKGIAIWHRLRPILQDHEIEYKLYRTTKSQSASYIVRSILDNDTQDTVKIYIFGGDGSINEAISNLDNSDFNRLLLGYIPTGSSNDLARDLGYGPDNIDYLKELILSDHFRYMDLGRLTYNDALDKDAKSRYFTVSCGIGFDASVCYEANSSKIKRVLNKLKLGKLTYVFICLKQLLSVKKCQYSISLDGHKAMDYDKCYFVSMMNHRFQGGGIMFCPDAVDNDGLLDICYAHTISNLRILSILPGATKGKHVGKHGIVVSRAKTINIKTALPMYVHTDGEVTTKATDITVSCDAAKLRFIVN